MGRPKKNEDDYRSLAESRGLRWIEAEVVNTQTKTGWECRNGHRWQATYSNIAAGRGCPICALNARRKPLGDYHSLAEATGIEWLGPAVANTATRTWWRCRGRHEWESTYSAISAGHGCPHCAGNAPKSPRDYEELAGEHGLKWKGPTAQNTNTKTEWECRHGHTWQATYDTIRSGHGCPICAGNRRKVPEDYRSLAQAHGLEWIGPEVPNTNSRTGWRCESGHEWEATYGNIYMGHGCPYCAGKAPKTPEDYTALAQAMGLEWIGPPVRTTGNKTGWRCSNGHVWNAPYRNIYMGHGCPDCSGNRRRTPEQYSELARSRGFTWLGPEVRSNRVKTTWRCSEGHEWEAPYNSINRGLGCPHCGRRAKKTDEDYEVLAQRRGFGWLGENPGSVLEKTVWECPEGHQWEARYNDIDSGYGCPYCAGTVPKTPTDYLQLAQESGFQWLGPEVPTTHDKTQWSCEAGHIWEARYNDIQSGRGCPTCVDIVNGARVSNLQRQLCDMLDGEINAPCGPYRIDVAKEVDGERIAIEYDSWYWHGGKEDLDEARADYLVGNGWKVLRILSNSKLPTVDVIESEIGKLIAGAHLVELVLDDWGKGPIRAVDDTPEGSP